MHTADRVRAGVRLDTRYREHRAQSGDQGVAGAQRGAAPIDLIRAARSQPRVFGRQRILFAARGKRRRNPPFGRRQTR